MDIPVSQTLSPKWRKASPWWLLCFIPFLAIATSASLAPRVEIYTSLVCQAHKPPSVSGSTLNWRHLGSKGLSPRLSGNVSDIDISWTREPGTKVSTVEENVCASNPVVQAITAQFIAVMAASSGVLSCLTGAWWGAFSDRYGRTKALGITAMGAIVMDLNLVLVALFTDKFPGGYWFLITGFLIDGVLGGWTSGSAASHAYIADTTTEEARSHVFSLNLGLFFAGIALGPMIGSLLIKSTSQVLSVFLLSISIRSSYALFVWLVVPESLTEEQMQNSRKNDEELELYRGHPSKSLAFRSKKFIDPLIIFIPQKNNNPLKKNWNLTLIAFIYGLTHLLMGSGFYIFQYLAYSFDWNSEILGYYVGAIGFVRTLFLLVVIPVLIKYLRRGRPTAELTARPSEEEPLLSARSTPSTDTSMACEDLHSPSLDMNLVQLSLLIEMVAYISMGLSSNGLMFSLSAILLSMGSGLNPALQSLALAIYTRNGGTESGKLFGGLGVVTALSSEIIGPSMFGAIYAKTVAWFPQSIFFVSMITLSVSFILLCLVRLPKVVPVGELANGDIENLSLIASTAEGSLAG